MTIAAPLARSFAAGSPHRIATDDGVKAYLNPAVSPSVLVGLGAAPASPPVPLVELGEGPASASAVGPLSPLEQAAGTNASTTANTTFVDDGKGGPGRRMGSTKQCPSLASPLPYDLENSGFLGDSCESRRRVRGRTTPRWGQLAPSCLPGNESGAARRNR